MAYANPALSRTAKGTLHPTHTHIATPTDIEPRKMDKTATTNTLTNVTGREWHSGWLM
jgi:hypothetical protein